MVMIEQPPPPGCTGPAYLQMHLASAPVTLVMNNPNYTALLAFCEGNLTELSALPNAKNQPDAAKPQNTTFNADFRFGPPMGVPPTFRMTLDVPEFMVRCSSCTFLLCHKGSSALMLITVHIACSCGMHVLFSLSSQCAPSPCVLLLHDPCN